MAQAPCFETFHLPEPKLIFSGGGLSVDPKEGIEKFGPLEFDRSEHKNVSVGIVGTREGVQKVSAYIEMCRSSISAGLNSRGKAYDLLAMPDFPGCSEKFGFRCNLLTADHYTRLITECSVKASVSESDDSKRIRAVVQMLEREVRMLADLDPAPDVVVIALPKLIEDACASVGNRFRSAKIKLTFTQKRDRREKKNLAKVGQEVFNFLFPDDADGEKEIEGYWNIHHALKASVMDTGLPTQMIWESTLDNSSSGQDPASKAWNFITALYYKSGGIPWHIKELSHNTCYVGVSFYKESPKADASVQTSLAQIFGAQQGLILKGKRAVFDKSRDRKPHLTKGDAKALLENAIQLYSDQNGHKPRRVVVHKTSRYWSEELDGFKQALGEIPLYDFLTLEFLDKRFMRLGKKPPLRGTALLLDDRNYLLFTSGFIPFLRTYPGMRIPKPLEIVEHHGEATAMEVCSEILALTKINWNSCYMSSSLPITLRFSKSVGQILSELPPEKVPQAKYRFYM